MLKIIIASVLASSLLACAPDSGSGDSAQNNTATDTPEMASCRMAAESMIEVARQAVTDTSSRPERREARRVLMEDWVARLQAGENPCDVYAAIGQASTTF